MPRNSRAPSCAIAWTPKLFAGMAALMKRDGGAWKVSWRASTRLRISSSRPSSQTCRLLFASNSRWLSKSTFTCSRFPTMPAVRTAYWGTGLMVGKRAWQPERACCCSNAVHFKADRFRNLKCTAFEQQQALSGCQARFPTISPVPQYAVRTAGVVGKRLHVNVDFDSQREFDANNNLQVWYEGLEDEILRRVEAGNVTFQAPPSRFISAAIPANNFGVQAIAQLGALEFRGIYAQQKGNVVRDRVYSVGETTTQPIDRVARDLDYESGRFFFAADPALVPGYPAVDVLNIDRATLPDSLRVGSVRVYRVRAVSPTSTTNQNIGGGRAGAGGPGPGPPGA